MRIPPYYEKATWQRFFVGVFFGAIISWLVFLFIFGELQEAQLKKIATQQVKINNLINNKEVLEKDYQQLNKKNEKQLKIQEIEINFTNAEKLKIDSITLLSLKNEANSQLKHILNNNIESVAENKQLIFQTLENKIYKIDDQKFQVKVKEIYLYTTLSIYLEIKPSI